jgi:hypothetical protein
MADVFDTKRGGQSAVKLNTLIPRPHLSTKPGQAQTSSWVAARCMSSPGARQLARRSAAIRGLVDPN